MVTGGALRCSFTEANTTMVRDGVCKLVNSGVTVTVVVLPYSLTEANTTMVKRWRLHTG